MATPPLTIPVIASRSSEVSAGESPNESSSTSRSSGLAISPRPSEHICCSPPLRVPAILEALSLSAGKRVNTRSRSRFASPRSDRANAPMTRFSPTVMPVNRRLPSGTSAIPRLTRAAAVSGVMSRPAKATEPLLGRRIPAIVFRRVDLPTPFDPITATHSPRSTRRSTSVSTGTSP